MKKRFNHGNEMDRRAFVRRMASTALGVGILNAGLPSADAVLLDPVTSHPATAKSVIYLYMSGGLTHVDTFDVKPENKAIQGPLKAINSSVAGMRFGEHLPLIAKQAPHLAVINSMTTTQGAHQQGNYFMHTSYTMRGTIKHPCMGSWVSNYAGKRNATIPPSVLINGPSNHPGAGYMESVHMPLRVNDPASGLQHASRPEKVNADRYRRRYAKLQSMNKEFMDHVDHKQVRAYTDLYDEALRLMKSKDLAAFDINHESETLRTAYGDNSFGQGCLLARRLVEHGVRFVEVQLNGWDFHNDCFGRLAEKAPELDQGMGTLLADLNQRGMLEDTMVVLATEFGRTPKLNERELGRDHFPKAFSCVMAGGGIHGGQVYGKTDKDASNILENPVTPMDLNATIAYAMGMPVDKVIHSPSGRPFKIANKGRPITAIF